MESILRPWNINNVENLINYGSNPLIAMFMSDCSPHTFTAEKAKIFIEKTLNWAIGWANLSGEFFDELIYTILI